MVSVHDQLAPTFFVGGKVAYLSWSTWQSKLVTSSPGNKKLHVKKQGPTTPPQGHTGNDPRTSSEVTPLKGSSTSQ